MFQIQRDNRTTVIDAGDTSVLHAMALKGP